MQSHKTNNMRSTFLAFATFRKMCVEAEQTYGTKKPSAATLKRMHVLVEKCVQNIIQHIEPTKQTINNRDVLYMFRIVCKCVNFNDCAITTQTPTKFGHTMVHHSFPNRRIAKNVTDGVTKIYKWCICLMHASLKEHVDAKITKIRPPELLQACNRHYYLKRLVAGETQ